MASSEKLIYRQILIELPKSIRSLKLAEEKIREAILDNLVEMNEIDVPQEKLNNEINAMVSQLHSELRYDSLMNGTPHFFIQQEIEEQMDDIRTAALRTVKLDIILKQIIALEHITVSREELEAEAQAISKRQSIPLERIYDFLGTDLKLLTRDLQERKAVELVVDSALITYV